jgi:hypothetical protein
MALLVEILSGEKDLEVPLLQPSGKPSVEILLLTVVAQASHPL